MTTSCLVQPHRPLKPRGTPLKVPAEAGSLPLGGHVSDLFLHSLRPRPVTSDWTRDRKRQTVRTCARLEGPRESRLQTPTVQHRSRSHARSPLPLEFSPTLLFVVAGVWCSLVAERAEGPRLGSAPAPPGPGGRAGGRARGEPGSSAGEPRPPFRRSCVGDVRACERGGAVLPK